MFILKSLKIGKIRIFYYIPFEQNDVLQQLISAAAQTANEMRNLSGSLGFAVRNADGTVHFTEIGKFYQDTVDNAINGIANGVFDYNTAIKKAVSALTNSGLRTVDYASGWSNRVDVAARRSVMTGIAQLTGKINEQNAEELGTDMFEVTWHGGARPSHQVWQGRWYTKKQLVSVCGLGSVTGLCGANCYHDYYPVIPGISDPTYTQEQLREMNRNENIPVEYGGKQYTKYEALQRQRRLETKMRAQRQEIHLLEVGGASEDDIIAARCRYRVTSGEYTRFSKAMDLPQQRERVTVDGLGNVGVGKWKIQGNKMQAPFPKGFKDNRNVGEIISQTDLESFAKKAEIYGVKLGKGKPGTYGGFEKYKGDPRVLDEALEHIKNNQPILTKISGDDKVILQYGDVTDSSGRVDVEAFAMTRGRTITLNRFMYDDTDYLIKEYADSVKSKHFVQGTDYRNIIDHEIGHVFCNVNDRCFSRLLRTVEKHAFSSGMTIDDYIKSNISKYAVYNKELLGEINSMRNSKFSNIAIELLEESGLL